MKPSELGEQTGEFIYDLDRRQELLERIRAMIAGAQAIQGEFSNLLELLRDQPKRGYPGGKATITLDKDVKSSLGLGGVRATLEYLLEYTSATGYKVANGGLSTLYSPGAKEARRNTKNNEGKARGILVSYTYAMGEDIMRPASVGQPEAFGPGRIEGDKFVPWPVPNIGTPLDQLQKAAEAIQYDYSLMVPAAVDTMGLLIEAASDPRRNRESAKVLRSDEVRQEYADSVAHFL